MGWKRALGISALCGARRDLDELLGEREEILYAIKHKQDDWKEMEACLPETERKIAILQAKVDAED